MEINYKKNNPRKSNTWRLNRTLLNKDWVAREIKEEIKNIMATNDNENTTIQKSMGHSESSLESEVHSSTGLLQKNQETMVINYLTLQLKELESYKKSPV